MNFEKILKSKRKRFTKKQIEQLAKDLKIDTKSLDMARFATWANAGNIALD